MQGKNTWRPQYRTQGISPHHISIGTASQRHGSYQAIIIIVLTSVYSEVVILSSLTIGISQSKNGRIRYICGLCSHNATSRPRRQCSPSPKARSRSKASSAPVLFIKMFSASQCTRKHPSFALFLSFQDGRAWGSTFHLAVERDVIGEVKDTSSGNPNVKAVYDLVREVDFGIFNMTETYPPWPHLPVTQHQRMERKTHTSASAAERGTSPRWLQRSRLVCAARVGGWRRLGDIEASSGSKQVPSNSSQRDDS
jgi:hypothetical protein